VTSSQWLVLMVGLQLMLFSIGWWTSAHKATTCQAAMRGLALFNLCMGVGTALVGLRGRLPYLVTNPLSNLLSLLAMVVLWHAGQSLTGKRYSTVEQLLVLLVGGSLIIGFGGDPEQGQERVACYFLAAAWVASRGAWQAFQRLRAEALQVAAWALLATGGTTSALFVWRAIVGITSQEPIEFDYHSDTTNTMALVLMVGVFSLNMVFAQVVFGRMTRALEKLSRHDALTGLLNRRAIDEALQTEWDRFRRSDVAFSVACIDIDHFKSVNDGWGHATGDSVLVAVARRIGQHLRPGDCVGRSGGDEFLVVLSACVAEEAGVAAERLRAAVDALPLAAGEGRLVLSVSIGVATATAADRTAEAVLLRADAALYRAKDAGRNTVCAAPDDTPALRSVA
jgi:diguanylate cyclase (GGDEF)-like protein